MPAETIARATKSFRAWCLAGLLELSCKQSRAVPSHQPWPHSDIYVARKESSQAADLLRFSLLRRQASTHMTILALPEASLHYEEKKQPKKKPAVLGCSNWISLELRLPGYLIIITITHVLIKPLSDIPAEEGAVCAERCCSSAHQHTASRPHHSGVASTVLLAVSIQRQVEFQTACLAHQSITSTAPTYLSADIQLVSEHGRRHLRSLLLQNTRYATHTYHSQRHRLQDRACGTVYRLL